MTPPTAHPETKVPPLVDGERLTSDEFERRYEAMPDVKKAELIEGVVHMPSPVSSDFHGEPHANLIGLLYTYRIATPGTRVTDNATLRLDLENVPQPDVVLYIEPHRGGQARLNAGFIEGAPELVGEVAASSVSIDRNTKLQVYRRGGVKEYLLWRVNDAEVDYFVLRHGQFVPLPLSPDRLYRSETFPGLWIDPEALVVHEFARLHSVLQQGLASPEHAAFVARLTSAGPAT